MKKKVYFCILLEALCVTGNNLWPELTLIFFKKKGKL